MPNINQRVRNFANLSKPDIQVYFDSDGCNGRNYINSFTTGDRIQGHVTIVTSNDTRFDQLEIALIGQIKCYVDRISPSAAISARSEAFQMFLKMDCPISQSDMPGNGVLKAEHEYKVPFNFVVPGSLPGSCKHTTANPMIKDWHLQLPPSLGDPEMAGRGSQLMDDCAPEMARITYAVRTRIYKWRDTEEKHIIVSERSRRIRIIPAYAEQPPISVDETDEDYCLRAEKGVRKNLLKAKTGRLVIEASQPKSLHLPCPKEDHTGATTMASVQLRFDPLSANAEPPKLGQLTSKLRVGTFYASTPRVKIPTGKSALSDTSQGIYVDVLNLSSRCMSGTEWTKHDPRPEGTSTSLRRDSAMSMSMGGSAECPAQSSIYKSELPFYTAQLLIPISPPKNKILVPSFQSCLASRVYILEVTLTISQASNMTLKVPIQITSEGGIAPPPDFAEATAEAEAEAAAEGEDELADLEESDSVEQYLTPRRISSPEDALAQAARRRVSPPRRRSVQAAPPPEYSTFAPRSGGVLRSAGASTRHRLPSSNSSNEGL